jgi:hypothetical protein
MLIMGPASSPTRGDRLFLLHPDRREDRPDGWYCPDCALVEGVLRYYPQIEATLEVIRLPFARPRAPLVALLGPDWQDCPLLAIDPAWPVEGPIVNGHRVITENTRAVLDALAVIVPGVSRSGSGSLFAALP